MSARAALRVARSAQQQRATNNEHRREKDSESTYESTGNLSQSAAERTGEVAVDAEGGQQSECNERHPPHVMTMAREGITNRTRSCAPSSSSSLRICKPRAGWATRNCSAACVKLLLSITLTKYRNCRISKQGPRLCGYA